MSFQQYNIYPGFTPVRLVSTSNIAGVYFNGQTNNGVGATLTIAASSLTIDAVLCVVGDRVLLQTQTNTNETGIYVVESIGSVVVLKRAADMQCIEQIRAGQFVSVGAGSVAAGNIFSIVEPLPAHFGIDALVINSDPSAGGVSFSGGPSTANAIVVFSNASGDIKAADAAPVTLGQNLAVTGTITSSGTITTSAGNIVVTAGTITSSGTITTSAGNIVVTAGTITSSGTITTSAGNIVVTSGTITASGAITSTAGNITSGSSGDAGTFISFPGTAANGTLIVAAANAGAAFNTTISNGTMGQSTVYTVADIAAATGGIPDATGAGRMKMVADAAVAGGAATQNVVDAFCTAASVVLAVWQTQANAAVIRTVVPGVGSFDIISDVDAGAGTVNYVIMK